VSSSGLSIGNIGVIIVVGNIGDSCGDTLIERTGVVSLEWSRVFGGVLDPAVEPFEASRPAARELLRARPSEEAWVIVIPVFGVEDIFFDGFLAGLMVSRSSVSDSEDSSGEEAA
jgi:hypothetical protein